LYSYGPVEHIILATSITTYSLDRFFQKIAHF